MHHSPSLPSIISKLLLLQRKQILCCSSFLFRDFSSHFTTNNCHTTHSLFQSLIKYICYNNNKLVFASWKHAPSGPTHLVCLTSSSGNRHEGRFPMTLHSLIRGVLIQSCSARAKNFANYVFCHPQFSGVILLSKILKIIVPLWFLFGYVNYYENLQYFG